MPNKKFSVWMNSCRRRYTTLGIIDRYSSRIRWENNVKMAVNFSIKQLWMLRVTQRCGQEWYWCWCTDVSVMKWGSHWLTCQRSLQVSCYGKYTNIMVRLQVDLARRRQLHQCLSIDGATIQDMWGDGSISSSVLSMCHHSQKGFVDVDKQLHVYIASTCYLEALAVLILKTTHQNSPELHKK